MTWASQAYNPGSNPGDRIIYTSSTIQTQMQTTIHHIKSCKRSFQQRDVKDFDNEKAQGYTQQDLPCKIPKPENPLSKQTSRRRFTPVNIDHLLAPTKALVRSHNKHKKSSSQYVN